MEKGCQNKTAIRKWLEKNNKKLLIILNIINVLLVVNIGILLAVSNNIIEPEENQYLELRAVEIKEVNGKNKQLIMELWANNIDLKGFDVYFAYDSQKLEPSIIQTNEITANESEYFEFTEEFKDALELYAIPTKKGEIRGVVTFAPPVEEKGHIVEREGVGKVIDTKGGVLLGKMSFQMKTPEFDISWFHLVEDKLGSLKTGVKTSSDGTKYYQSATTFRFTDIKIAPDGVKEITIGKTPQTEYKYGEKLNVEEGSIIVTKNNGEKEEIKITPDMVEGLNPNKLGEQTITITYEGKKTTYTVQVKDYIKDIEIQKPEKLIYNIGEQMDLTGGTVRKIMASGAKRDPIDMADASVKIEGFETDTKGAKLIKVTYEGITKGFGITVVEKVEGIDLKQLPTKTEYLYGEELDISGGKLEVTNEEGEKELLEITKEMVTGYDPKKLGYQTLTIKYEKLEVEYIVHVKDYMKSLKVEAPKKLEYEYGEELDLTGGTVTVIMASGKIDETTDLISSMISEYNKEKIGKQTVKVEYKGLKGSFNVTVVDRVKGISMYKEPNKTQYKYGESLDITGATIRVIKSSGTTIIPVTKDMISGYNPKVCGTQVITVTYGGFSAEFVVNVEKDEEKPDTNTTGGNTIGGNTTGGNTTGENTTGENITGENITVGNTTGGNTAGGNTTGENTTVGNTTGGNIAGGNTIDGTNSEGKPSGEDTQKPTQTLGEQEEKSEVNTKLVFATLLGISGIVLLIIVIIRKNNIKIYVAEDIKYELIAKDRITKNNSDINVDKYLEEIKLNINEDEQTNKIKVKIELSKSISKKLDEKEVQVTLRNQTSEHKITYNEKSFKIYL